MSDFYKKLGKKLKDIRERFGISQDTLAKKLELPRPAISQIERGERTVTADELIKLSSVFHVPIDAILDLKKEPEVTLSKAQIIKHPRSPKKDKEESHIRINVPQKNMEKFKEVLLYILQRVGSRPNIGETVIYKLLYFMDFNYYEKYEEQLIGAQYQKNRFGPTPIEFAKIVEQMMKNGEIEKVKSKYFDYPQTKYLPIRKPDLSKLSATELAVIEDVLNLLSDMNAQQISDYSHGDVPWRTAEEETIIGYEAVFYRAAPYSVREYPNE